VAAGVPLVVILVVSSVQPRPRRDHYFALIGKGALYFRFASSFFAVTEKFFFFSFLCFFFFFFSRLSGDLRVHLLPVLSDLAAIVCEIRTLSDSGDHWVGD